MSDDPWAQVTREPDDENPAFYTRDVYDAEAVDRARQQDQEEIDRLRAEKADWVNIIEHHRAMALRFAEDRDEHKHENRGLKAAVARLTAARAAQLQVLARALIILEALQLSVQWELAPEILTEIAETLHEGRSAILAAEAPQ